MITLLDGRTVDQAHVFFHPDTYKFTADNGEDLTWLIKLTDKDSFPGFDRSRWFTIVSDLKNTGAIQPELNTSTWDIFWQQISTDPLAAPLEQADKAFDEIVNSAVAPKIGLAIGAVVVILALIVVAKR